MYTDTSVHRHTHTIHVHAPLLLDQLPVEPRKLFLVAMPKVECCYSVLMMDTAQYQKQHSDNEGCRNLIQKMGWQDSTKILPLLVDYSPFIKRWALALASSRIWRFFVISSYTVQCCELKFEKGSKKVPELGFEPHNALLQAGSNGLDFDGFPDSVLLG